MRRGGLNLLVHTDHEDHLLRLVSELAPLVTFSLMASGCFTSFPDRSVCGDGFVEGNEDCDDGNTFGGDGCSAACRWEIGPLPICGNAIVEVGEDCDPPVAGFCSFDCQIIATGTCGNGVIEPGEDCDPPDGVICSANCTLVANQIEIGAPCNTTPDCGSSPNPDLQTRCVNEPGFPGGLCVLIGCWDLGAGDNCPTGSRCVAAAIPGLGTPNVCAPSCAPSGDSNGGCRPDEDASGAYACYTFVSGGGGVCWTGCADDTNCNDPFLPPPEWPYACDALLNRCYVVGAPGAVIGDPCFDDTDCTLGGDCLQGDWTADGIDDWPGGYCSKIGCASYAGNPIWECPNGSTCGTATPWIASLTLDICLADCTGDGAGGSCGRPDDYTCMDFANQLDPQEDAIAETGEPGWCFDCQFERAVFGEDPSACP